MPLLRCDYCGWRPELNVWKAGDKCPKCRGVLCAKGTKGNP